MFSDRLEQVKATKLRSPNFHVSRTRLAVYNVPKSMTEPELRQLLIDAVKSRATKQNPFVKQVCYIRNLHGLNMKSRGISCSICKCWDDVGQHLEG